MLFFFILDGKLETWFSHYCTSCPASNGLQRPISPLSPFLSPAPLAPTPNSAYIYAFPVRLPWRSHKRRVTIAVYCGFNRWAQLITQKSPHHEEYWMTCEPHVLLRAAETNRTCWLCLIITLSDGPLFFFFFYCVVCTGHTARVLNCLNGSCADGELCFVSK